MVLFLDSSSRNCKMDVFLTSPQVQTSIKQSFAIQFATAQENHNPYYVLAVENYKDTKKIGVYDATLFHHPTSLKVHYYAFECFDFKNFSFNVGDAPKKTRLNDIKLTFLFKNELSDAQKLLLQGTINISSTAASEINQRMAQYITAFYYTNKHYGVEVNENEGIKWAWCATQIKKFKDSDEFKIISEMASSLLGKHFLDAARKPDAANNRALYKCAKSWFEEAKIQEMVDLLKLTLKNKSK